MDKIYALVEDSIEKLTGMKLAQAGSKMFQMNFLTFSFSSIISRKINSKSAILHCFYDSLVKSTFSQKHLGLVLDVKIDFKIHQQNIYAVSSQTSKYFTLFQIIYKTHLEYGNIIYDQAYNSSFHRKWNQFNTTHQ